MDIISKIVASISTLQAKDWVTLGASLSALIISLLSYRQKSKEGRIALRNQLTTLLEKLTDLNMNAELSKVKKDDYPPNYINLLNDQRRFLVRQASFILTRITDLVSPYEYLLIAGSFDEINDPYQAEINFTSAIENATDAVDKGIAYRGFGRYLFHQGEDMIDIARARFERAISTFPELGDRNIIYRADTHERWAALELEYGHRKEALFQFECTVAEYARLSNPSRRTFHQNRLKSIASKYKSAIAGPKDG
jgi:hypothetical protein